MMMQTEYAIGNVTNLAKLLKQIATYCTRMLDEDTYVQIIEP